MVSRKIWIKSNRKRKGRPYTAIKALLWIGAIASPMLVGSRFGTYSPVGAMVCFVWLAISIPVAILTHHAINASESKSDIIPLAIMAIVSCSLLAGILILASKSSRWEAPKDPNDDSWRFGKQG